jgi:hypothetical protein
MQKTSWNLKAEAWQMHDLFFALNQRFGPGARRTLPQLAIEIESNFSKPKQIRFLLRKQAEYFFNAPILADVPTPSRNANLGSICQVGSANLESICQPAISKPRLYQI